MARDRFLEMSDIISNWITLYLLHYVFSNVPFCIIGLHATIFLLFNYTNISDNAFFRKINAHW